MGCESSKSSKKGSNSGLKVVKAAEATATKGTASGGNEKIPPLFKVVVVGDVNTGKTSLLMRFVSGTFSNEMTTDSLEKPFSADGVSSTFELWDTRGQERFRTVTSSFYRKASGTVVVFDVTDMASYEAVESWLHEVRRYCTEDVPVLVVGMKNDLNDKRVIPKEELDRLRKKEPTIRVVEASAKTGAGVTEGFTELFRLLVEYARAHPSQF